MITQDTITCPEEGVYNKNSSIHGSLTKHVVLVVCFLERIQYVKVLHTER